MSKVPEPKYWSWQKQLATPVLPRNIHWTSACILKNTICNNNLKFGKMIPGKTITKTSYTPASQIVQRTSGRLAKKEPSMLPSSRKRYVKMSCYIKEIDYYSMIFFCSVSYFFGQCIRVLKPSIFGGFIGCLGVLFLVLLTEYSLSTHF